ADEVLGDGLFRRINVADRPAYLKAIDDAASGRDVTVELRIRCDQSAQPAFAWVEMACKSTLGPQSDSEVVASLRNIETRKEGERELVSACEEAERTSLAKSRFLARNSHDLRTPLNAVNGLPEILAKE